MKRFYFLKRFQILVAAAMIASFGLAPQASAQQARNSKDFKIDAAFKPAFFCKPAVNRIEARKGQTIPFEFRMEPVRENVRVRVRPVALRQLETGAVQADIESPAPPEVLLETEEVLDLKLGEETVLRGKIRLPKNDSDFHSFGLLVQDNGYLSESNQQTGDVTYGVKFVSQYILRCDITITNGRGTDIKNLQIETAELVEHNGVPSASVMVFNPTGSTIEFEMESSLTRDGYANNKKGVNLFAQINSNETPPEKFSTRIFPRTRLRMVAGWPTAIFPGQFNMETKVTRKRKTIFTATTPVTIEADTFPAQSTFAAQVSPGVHVHPSQLFLSRQRGAKRFIPVNLSNLSDQEVTLDMAPVDAEGQIVDWLSVRPQQFSIKPGTSRKAMLSVTSRADQESHRFAYLNIIEVNPDGSEHKQCNLPVAFQGSQPFQPVIATNSLRIDDKIEGGAFVVDVMNQSALPFPINATVKFKSATGNTLTSETGYGKWLLPSAQRRLEFKIDASIPEGDLPVSLTFTDAKDKLIAKREFVLDVQKPVAPQNTEPGSPGEKGQQTEAVVAKSN